MEYPVDLTSDVESPHTVGNTIASEKDILSQNPWSIQEILPYIPAEMMQIKRIYVQTQGKMIFRADIPPFGDVIVKVGSISTIYDEYNEFLHEGFIGLYGLNQLRQPSSNFALVYRVYFDEKCPKYPKLTGTRGLCTYTLYEYIPGETFKEYLMISAIVQQFKEILLQIFIALIMAYREVGFTHYDLHLGNIVLRRVDRHEISYSIDR